MANARKRKVVKIESPLLTLAEAAQLLRISPRTMRRVADDGEIRAIRIRRTLRFHKDDLHSFLSGK